MDDLYSRLHCDQGDSQLVLKKSYQQLLLQLHPDKTGGHQCDRLLAVQEAWKVLGSLEGRRQYDAQLSNSRLLASQDSAIWRSFLLSELQSVGQEVEASCRCGGFYRADREELVEELQQAELLLDCDTCSLQILVTLS